MRTAALILILCSATLTAAVTPPKFFARRDYPALVAPDSGGGITILFNKTK